MYRAAEKGTLKAITANRMIDGLVVFLADDRSWTEDVDASQVFEDGEALDKALAFSAEQAAERVVLDPYTIDVTVEDGKPVPSRLRELIRAKGPSVAYGEEERKRLAEAE